MLSKRVCLRCIRKEFHPELDPEDPVQWEKINSDRWFDGLQWAYCVRSIDKRIDIRKPPPIGCQYKMEHAIAETENAK